MGILIDVIILAIIIFCVFLSAKKGFVRTAIEVAGFILAILISLAVSKPLSSFVYDKTVEPGVINAVSDASVDSTKNAADALWEKLPEFIKINAQAEGITADTVSQRLTENSDIGIKAAAKTVSSNIIKPVFVSVVSFAVSAALFVVLMIVVRFLARLLNKFFSFSIIGKMNSALGGAIGLIKGVLVATAVCMVISSVVSFTANGFLIFTEDNIGKTYVFKFLVGLF